MLNQQKNGIDLSWVGLMRKGATLYCKNPVPGSEWFELTTEEQLNKAIRLKYKIKATANQEQKTVTKAISQDLSDAATVIEGLDDEYYRLRSIIR